MEIAVHELGSWPHPINDITPNKPFETVSVLSIFGTRFFVCGIAEGMTCRVLA
jgi:hypothetical protein